MKKLLVILMLGSGFVTVDSAAVDCSSPHAYNQCCTDISEMYQTAAGGVIPAMHGDSVTWLSKQLTNDGSTSTHCATTAKFTTPDETHHSETCEWERDNWQNSIQCS